MYLELYFYWCSIDRIHLYIFRQNKKYIWVEK